MGLQPQPWLGWLLTPSYCNNVWLGKNVAALPLLFWGVFFFIVHSCGRKALVWDKLDSLRIPITLLVALTLRPSQTTSSSVPMYTFQISPSSQIHPKAQKAFEQAMIMPLISSGFIPQPIQGKGFSGTIQVVRSYQHARKTHCQINAKLEGMSITVVFQHLCEFFHQRATKCVSVCVF